MVVNFEDYKLQKGDVVSAGILRLIEDTGEYEVLKEVSVTVASEADEAQLEFSREDTYDISGDLVIETRLIRNNAVEKTLQKAITLGKDGLR